MTVNLEDRSSSQLGTTAEEEEVEEPRLGGTDIFRGGLVIGLAMLIGGFVMLRGLTQDSAESDSVATELAPAADSAVAGAEDSAATTTDEVGESSTTAGITRADESTPLPGDDAAADGTASDDTVADSDAMAESDEAAEGEAMEESSDNAAADPNLRSPAEVRVLVLNGAAQRQGVAASGTEVLKAASYNTAAPKNATKTTAQSLILYLDGYQAEAQAVANTFGPDLTGIVQPYDAANPPIDDIQSANVIVIIGEDDIIPIS